jgi:transcription elongation factor GreA
MMDEIVYVTADGLASLKAELEERLSVRRVEIADRLEKAIKMGDLKENADYHVAKEDQAFNEGRIQTLQNQLLRVQIIREPVRKNVVHIGSTVTIAEEGYEDEEETYKIVGATEADPNAGLISNVSPIGRALLGARLNDTVEAQTPGGTVTFVILKIE